MTVDRRRLLAGVPAAVVGSALFASAATACSSPEKAGPENASSVNGPEVHWRMMVSWPKDLSIMYGGAQFVADRVKAMTGGRFTMDLHVEGDLDTKDDLMTAVNKGFVQCGHSSSDYYVDKNAGLTFGSGPLRLDRRRTRLLAAVRRRNGPHQRALRQIRDRVLPGGQHRLTDGRLVQQGNPDHRRPRRPTRMRIGGIGAEVMKTFGVTPISKPYLELAAIKSGELDAAEFVAPFDDTCTGLNNVAKYYYSPGWWQIGDQLDFIVNKKAFSELPVEYQQIVESAAWEANQRVVAEYDARNGDALAALVAGGTPCASSPST